MLRDIQQKRPCCNDVSKNSKAQKPSSNLLHLPFSHFTRHGIIPDPSSAEYEAIVNDISYGESKLSDIEDKISKAEDKICCLQDVINPLREERERMKKYVSNLESIFAPIRRLPAEVLCEIFRMVGTVTVWSRWSSLVPPISHVCHFWRSVSLELSELWSYIKIEYSPKSCVITYGPILHVSCVRCSLSVGLPELWPHIKIKRFSKSWVVPQQPVMETFITRSKGSPLSFELLDHALELKHDKTFLSIVDFTVSNSRRWKHITLKIPSRTHRIFSLARDAVPLLESLLLIGDLNGLEYIEWSKNAPALRSLSLLGVFMIFINCPWNQLTVLRLEGDPIFLVSLYTTLDETSNLQELDIYVNFGSLFPHLRTVPHRTVELPNLKKLSVRSGCSDNVGAILSTISATSLRDLIVTVSNVNNNREVIDCVISLINISMATGRLTVTLFNSNSITEALVCILLESPGEDAALQFKEHKCAIDSVIAFKSRTICCTLPGGTQISNPFWIRSLGYLVTYDELMYTLRDPGVFIKEDFAVVRGSKQRWVKLSFQRPFEFSQVYDRKLCEGEIQLLNFN